MFAMRLTTLPPFNHTAVANALGRKVHCDTYQSDATLRTVSQALLYDRLEDGDEWYGSNCEVYDETEAEGIIRATVTSENYLRFNIVNSNPTQVTSKIDEIMPAYEDWEEKKDIHKFIETKVNGNVRVFVNEKLNSAMVFIISDNWKIIHLMESFMPRYFPKLFKAKPIKPIELKMLESLTKSNHDSFMNAVREVGEQMKLREIILESMVKGFEKKNINSLINSANEELRNIMRSAADYIRYYNECMENKDKINIRIMGLYKKAEEKTENDELFEYLVDHPNIDVQNVQGENIDIIIYTDMKYFDVDQYLCMKRNGAILTNHRGSNRAFSAREDRELLLDAIFSENPLLKIKTAAGYRLSLNGSVFGLSIDGHCRPDYMPNPHIERHHCLGGHGPAIMERLRQGDMILAIEQCIASAASINVGEVGPTFGPMLENIFSFGDKKILQNKDGVDMSPAEALNWLKETGFTGIQENTMTFTEDDD